MAEAASGKKSIVQLILVPSLITLAITVVRVEGELHHLGVTVVQQLRRRGRSHRRDFLASHHFRPVFRAEVGEFW